MTDPTPLLLSIRRSHDKLAAAASRLDPSDLVRPSFCSEWTVAQVLSHLGSQAEVFSLFLTAGLEGNAAPDQSTFGPIWEAWNSKSPAAQAQDSIEANERFVRRLEVLDDQQLASFRLDLFGMDVDAARLLRMRLSEHAIHSWDVAVVFDHGERVVPDAVELLIDGLEDLVARVGKPSERSTSVAVTTGEPQRHFVLKTGGVSLDPVGGEPAKASIELPAEALLRLVYGRLDDANLRVGEVAATGITLAELQVVFPGI